SGSQHTFYIVSNSEMNAITHKERIVIALLASYKNRSLFDQYVKPFNDWFNVTHIDQLKALGGLIKFADALNDSHLNVVKDVELKKEDGEYTLNIYHRGSVIAEQY